jgi:hypothetical protein
LKEIEVAGTTTKEETAVEAEAPAAVQITTAIVEVTPDIAREWLDTMVANRNVSATNLTTLMRAMEEGRWHTDGSPIKFNTHGHLIDGQHRLRAVINTGLAQTFLVVWGVPDEAMTTLDTGKMRNRGDVLKIHDPALTDVNNVASVATIMVRWVRGFRGNNLRNEYISNDALVHFYDKNKDDIVASNRYSYRVTNALGAGSRQSFGLCYWLFSMIDTDDAEFFWDRLVDGQGLESGNPIYALRELLRREALLPGTRDKMRADVIIAITIKAWNAYRDGETINLLRFKVGGAHPEKYPEPH